MAVQAMVFNDQERLGNEVAGQTLPSNPRMKLMNEKSISRVLLLLSNECWQGTASKNHLNCLDSYDTFSVSHAMQIL